MKIIENVIYPYVYTDTGERIEIKDLQGAIVKGAMIDDNNNVVSGSDSECVGGVCPIK